MQTYELVEVAGLLSAHARTLVFDQPQLSEESLVDYWVGSRCRFDSWGFDLRSYAVGGTKSEDRPFTPRLFRLAVEIEASEVLARTMAAIATAHDTVHKRHESAPVATNTLVCHREAALRLHTLVASRDPSAYRDVARFRYLRRQLHELTDQFIGCILPLAPVAAYAHDAQRAQEWGELAAERIAKKQEPTEWPQLATRIAQVRPECAEHGPNSEHNHRIAAAAIGLFAPELFDSFGLLRTTWLRRLERVTSDTTVLVEEWLGLTEPGIPSNRLRR
jgi:hypothetical protein